MSKKKFSRIDKALLEIVNDQDFGMMPSHPGAIVREEILAPLNLNVTQAAKALGVRRATLADLLNEKAALSPGNGAPHRSFRRQHGDDAAHSDRLGHCRDAAARGRI